MDMSATILNNNLHVRLEAGNVMTDAYERETLPAMDSERSAIVCSISCNDVCHQLASIDWNSHQGAYQPNIALIS